MQRTDGLGAATIGGFFAELSDGARRQANVVFALIFKDFISDSPNRSALSMLYVMLEPATYSWSLSLFWFLMKRQYIDGVAVSLYISMSMLPYLIVQQSLSAIPRAISANESFYYFQQVKPIDSLIARFILDWSLMVIGSAITIFLIEWYLGYTMYLDNMLQVIGMVLMATAMGFGCGMFMGTYGTLYPLLYKLVSYVQRALLVLSGVFIDIKSLPLQAQTWLGWNPLAHLIDFTRHYAFHTKTFAGSNLTFPLLFTLFMVFLGTISYYANRHRLIEK